MRLTEVLWIKRHTFVGTEGFDGQLAVEHEKVKESPRPKGSSGDGAKEIPYDTLERKVTFLDALKDRFGVEFSVPQASCVRRKQLGMLNN
jgi:hypothetical protein